MELLGKEGPVIQTVGETCIQQAPFLQTFTKPLICSDELPEISICMLSSSDEVNLTTGVWFRGTSIPWNVLREKLP